MSEQVTILDPEHNTQRAAASLRRATSPHLEGGVESTANGISASDAIAARLLDNLGQLLDLLARERSTDDDRSNFVVKCLTLNEVAGVLKISRRSVDILIDSGELPKPIRLGDRIVRVRIADLASFLARKAKASH